MGGGGRPSQIVEGDLTEKLRAYQQHISRVAADAQVELARVTEQPHPADARMAEWRRNGAGAHQRADTGLTSDTQYCYKVVTNSTHGTGT